MSSSLILIAVWTGARAMLKVALLCAIGAIAYKRNVFDQSTSKVLSKMFIQLFLPLLIFSKTALAITPENVSFLPILITFAVVYLVIGHFVGAFLYFAFRHSLPPPLQLSLIPATAFGNNGDLVLSIVMSLGGVSPFHPEDVDRGIAYVSIWYSIFNLVFYGLSVNCFKADFDHIQNHQSCPQLDTLSLSQSSGNSIQPSSPSTPSSHVILRSNTCFTTFYSILRTIWSHPFTKIIFFPPNIALALGLLVSLIPSIKSLFLPLPTTPLSFVFDAVNFLGQAAVPISMTIFGGALTTIELNKSVLKQYPGLLWSSLALIVFRLIALPIIGITLASWATTSGWIPINEPMLRFVIMVQACVPTAQICILMTQYYHPRGESKEMATLMLIQYVAAMVTLTACLGYIIHILNSVMI